MGSEKIKVYACASCMTSSLGFSTGENFAAVMDYRSGCVKPGRGTTCQNSTGYGAADRPLGLIDRMAAGKILADIPDDYTFLEKLFISNIRQVCREAGVTLTGSDTLLIISTTKGNIELLSADAERVDEKVYLWKMAERVGKYFHTVNKPLVVSNACISGVSAMITASRLIRSGKYANVIVAGGDTITDFVSSGFAAFRSLSGEVCRPFDKERDGLTLGEGCGAILLTSNAGKAGPGAVEIAGGAITNDANHISGPSRTGEELAMAINNALSDAGIAPSDAGFVNAHGTATVFNDEMESKAFALAGLDGKPVNSLKPYFGHTLGAAGIVETIICVEQLRHNVITGTPGFRTCGTPVPVDISPEHRYAELNSCIKTASGFGGCNAAIVLRKQGNPGHKDSHATPHVYVSAETELVYDGDDFPTYIRQLYKASGESNMKFYKMDDLCKLGYVAALQLLDGTDIVAKYSAGEVGVVLNIPCSSLDSDIRHQRHISGGADASPSVFVYTLANIVAGEICIRHGIKGENTCFVLRDPGDGFIEEYARLLLENGYLKAVLCGSCDLVNGRGSARLKLLETKHT